MKPAFPSLLVVIALAFALPGCVLPEAEEPTSDGQTGQQVQQTAGTQDAGEEPASDDPQASPEPAKEPANPVFTGDVKSDETTSGACTNGPLAPFCGERRVVVAGIASDLPPLPTLVQTFTGEVEIVAVEGDAWTLEAVMHATGFSQAEAEERANAIEFEWSTRAEDGSYALSVVARPTTPIPLYSQGADMRLEFPRDIALGLNASTSSGSVLVAGLIGGSVGVETGSGSIDLESLDVGDLAAMASSGKISVDAITAKLVQIETGSGGISADDVEAKQVNLMTSSGAIDVASLVADVLQAQTGSGGISVDDAVVATTNITVSSGSVTFDGVGRDLGIQTGSGTIRATFIPTTTGLVELDSSSGTIVLQVPEDAEHGYSITVATSSGTRQITLQDGEHNAGEDTDTFVTSGFDQRAIQTTAMLEAGSGSITVTSSG